MLIQIEKFKTTKKLFLSNRYNEWCQSNINQENEPKLY